MESKMPTSATIEAFMETVLTWLREDETIRACEHRAKECYNTFNAFVLVVLKQLVWFAKCFVGT